MRVPSRTSIRSATIAVLALCILVAGACAPAPQAAKSIDWFKGGSYPIRVEVQSRRVTTDFTLFGTRCTSTATTPAVSIRGSLTVAPVELDPGLTRVSVPGVRVSLPSTSLSAGSWSLTCGGRNLGTIGVTLTFDATASLRTAMLDMGVRTLRLSDPTLSLTGIRATFAGAPAGTTPMRLAAMNVTVPVIEVAV